MKSFDAQKQDSSNYKYIETQRGVLFPNPSYKDPALQNLPIHPDIDFLNSPRDYIANEDMRKTNRPNIIKQIVEEFKEDQAKDRFKNEKEKETEVIDYIEGWRDMQKEES